MLENIVLNSQGHLQRETSYWSEFLPFLNDFSFFFKMQNGKPPASQQEKSITSGAV